MICLCNDGVDGNGNSSGIVDGNGIGNGIIEYIELEGDNVGTDDIDISEGLVYLISFLPSRNIVSIRRQMV